VPEPGPRACVIALTPPGWKPCTFGSGRALVVHVGLELERQAGRQGQRRRREPDGARLGAKIGLGITGIAGPGGATPGKKVGLTYVAVDSDEHSAVKKYEWPYDREGNRLASVGAALDLLERAIE